MFRTVFMLRQQSSITALALWWEISITTAGRISHVACDSTASLYYHNLGGKLFEEIGVQAGVAYSDDGAEQAGMGVAAADFTHDGMLDIFKTNFADYTPFYRNRGKNDFADKTIESGLAVTQSTSGGERRRWTLTTMAGRI